MDNNALLCLQKRTPVIFTDGEGGYSKFVEFLALLENIDISQGKTMLIQALLQFLATEEGLKLRDHAHLSTQPVDYYPSSMRDFYDGLWLSDGKDSKIKPGILAIFIAENCNDVIIDLFRESGKHAAIFADAKSLSIASLRGALLEGGAGVISPH